MFRWIKKSWHLDERETDDLILGVILGVLLLMTVSAMAYWGRA